MDTSSPQVYLRIRAFQLLVRPLQLNLCSKGVRVLHWPWPKCASQIHPGLTHYPKRSSLHVAALTHSLPAAEPGSHARLHYGVYTSSPTIWDLKPPRPNWATVTHLHLQRHSAMVVLTTECITGSPQVYIWTWSLPPWSTNSLSYISYSKCQCQHTNHNY